VTASLAEVTASRAAVCGHRADTRQFEQVGYV
jgi:hypothetical protein